ncbi:hypothetical protein ABZX12_27155 [Kribbella sp. NPDC003505]
MRLKRWERVRWRCQGRTQLAAERDRDRHGERYGVKRATVGSTETRRGRS